MDRQLTREDILNAKDLVLYDDDIIFVILSDDEVYGHRFDGTKWYKKDNYWDFYDSSLMLSYLHSISTDEVLKWFEKWESKN